MVPFGFIKVYTPVLCFKNHFHISFDYLHSNGPVKMWPIPIVVVYIGGTAKQRRKILPLLSILQLCTLFKIKKKKTFGREHPNNRESMIRRWYIYWGVRFIQWAHKDDQNLKFIRLFRLNILLYFINFNSIKRILFN